MTREHRNSLKKKIPSGVYRDGVEVDEDQAGGHDQVGDERERRQVLKVGRKDQKDEGGQEAEHVDAWVEAGHQHLCLVATVYLAVEGGGVGCLNHLPGRKNKAKKKPHY